MRSLVSPRRLAVVGAVIVFSQADRSSSAAAAPYAASTVIALEGDTAPKGAGTFVNFSGVDLNRSGQVSFTALLREGKIDENGAYRYGRSGQIEFIRTGHDVPGGPGRLDSFVTAPNLNNSGHVVFQGDYVGDAIQEGRNFGIYLADGRTTTSIARYGEAAPAGPGIYQSFGDPTLNNANQVAYWSRLEGDGVDWLNHSGIYRNDGPSTFEVARVGQAAPLGPVNSTTSNKKFH